MNPASQLETMLRQHKFTLVSQNKHLKFQNPEGKIYIMSKTPSDWRAIKNMVTTLKQVIASPVPSSSVIEEERQRKALEAEIALAAQRKATVGMQGAGKKAASNGTGFTYIDRPVQFITEDQKELDRIASQWVKFLHRVKKQRRDTADEFYAVYLFAIMVVAVAAARRTIARAFSNVQDRKMSKADLETVVGLAFHWYNKIRFMPDPDEQLLVYWQTGAPLEFNIVLPPADNERPVLTAFHQANRDAAIAAMKHDLLPTIETLFEQSKRFTYKRPAWLLPKEAQPELLPDVRRALQTIVETVEKSETQEWGVDFHAAMKKMAKRNRRLTFVADAAD